MLEKIDSEMMLRAAQNIKKRKLQFFGHVMRRKGLEGTIISGKVNGRKRWGRPTTSCLKDAEGWTGMSLSEAIRATDNCMAWSRRVVATTSHRDASLYDDALKKLIQVKSYKIKKRLFK